MCFDFDKYRAKPALRATVDDQKISQNLSLVGFGIQIGNIIRDKIVAIMIQQRPPSAWVTSLQLQEYSVLFPNAGMAMGILVSDPLQMILGFL